MIARFDGEELKALEIAIFTYSGNLLLHGCRHSSGLDAFGQQIILQFIDRGRLVAKRSRQLCRSRARQRMRRMAVSGMPPRLGAARWVLRGCRALGDSYALTQQSAERAFCARKRARAWFKTLPTKFFRPLLDLMFLLVHQRFSSFEGFCMKSTSTANSHWSTRRRHFPAIPYNG